MKVVIAFGSNLGDSRHILSDAIEKLRSVISIEQVSTIIETEPVGGVEQPNYLNGVLIGQSELEPQILMQRLLDIEAEAGRERIIRWGARTLDLDFIAAQDAAGDVVIESEILTLPHPRAHERAFVLAPWHEIDPDGHIPGKGLISALLAGLE